MPSSHIVNFSPKIDFTYINCTEIQFVLDTIYIALSSGKVWDFDESDNFFVSFLCDVYDKTPISS